MAVSINPLADYIVAKQVEAETKTASGLYLPNQAQEKPKVAEVLAVGPKVSQLKVGDKILYKSYSTTDVKVGAEAYILVKEEDVLATVN